MPLIKFQQGDKWGLKNASGKTLHEACFHEIFFCTQGVVALKDFEVIEESESYTRDDIFFIDHEGNIKKDIRLILETQGIDNASDIYQLHDDLFAFLYSTWYSKEFFGVFNIHGDIVLHPEFEEIEYVQNGIIKALYGREEQFSENYGDELDQNWYIFNNDGKLVYHYPIKFIHKIVDNEKILFKNLGGQKIVVDQNCTFTIVK